jgi:predicted 3-demethylubiquinone-9 3-methyltransferase (glyoxalase superfamily)
VDAVHKSPSDYPSGKAGDVLTVDFTILGQPFVGLNGGPTFTFDEAVSFQVFTDTQEETDRYWNAIVNGGGAESVCGWCRDKFGLSWQIVPRALDQAMKDPDTAAAKRVMEAMMQMKKIDIAKIEAARRG